MTDGMTDGMATIHAVVRERYARSALAVLEQAPGAGSAGADAAGCCGDGCGSAPGTTGADAGELIDPGAGIGAALYSALELAELPDAAGLASLGCGNPVAVAELREGERVLDLGSGGGIDVLLSARRVGPAGFAWGLDMTDEMLTLAQRNAAEAGIGNVAFVKGHIEAVPLPAGAVDVIISNCVVNLAADKPAVFREMARVLRPGGRIGVSDIVAEDHLGPDERAARGSYVGCIAGALSMSEYEEGLREAGFSGISVRPTHPVAEGMHSAIIRAVRPA